MTTSRPLIALLAAPNVSGGVLYGLFDVLASVGAVYPDMTVGVAGDEALEVRIVSLDGQPFRCLGGIAVEPHTSLAELPRPDAIVVCDFYSSVAQAPKGTYAGYADWLRRVHDDGALIASVCAGALVLAEAGLLDGREATTHWAYGDLFAADYPKVRLRRERTLCLSSEADRIVTAGGALSWQDLALYLVARFCGTRQALETAKIYLMAGHADGQLPFAVISRRVNASDEAIARSQEWIAFNYTGPNPVQRMAAHSGLNARTFARRFRAATGKNPLDYVHALRIEEAKQMLETDRAPVNEVSAAVGYEEPAAFRRLFGKLVGMTPVGYRRKFALPAIA